MRRTFPLKFLLWLAVIGCLMLAVVWAEPEPTEIPQRTLSLSEALNLAERQNPQLVAARKNLDVSQAGIGIAREIPNPFFQAQHYFGNIIALGTNQQVSLTQQIETAGKRKKRTLVARAQYTLTGEQYRALLWDVRSQVRQAYIQYAGAKENLALIDLQRKLASDLLDIADKRVKAGAAAMVEYLNAKLALSQVDAQEIQAQTQLNQAQGQLNSLLGNPMQPGITPPSGFGISDQGYFNPSKPSELVPPPNKPLPPFDELLVKAKRLRPDLIAAIQQSRLNENQLKLIKAQRIPDLYLSVGYPYLKLHQNVSPLSNRTYYYGLWLQAGFNIPVFNRQKYEIQQGQANLEQSKLQVNAVEKQIIGDIYNAYRGLEGATANVNLYQNNLLLSSAEVLMLAQKSYRYGKTGLTSVLLAQQEAQQIRQGYIQAVLDYHKAWADLEKAVGTELDF